MSNIAVHIFCSNNIFAQTKLLQQPLIETSKRNVQFLSHRG